MGRKEPKQTNNGTVLLNLIPDCVFYFQLYTGLTELFTGYTDLLHDFAGFLLPAQAVECGCFLSHQEFVRARSFLRKLEVKI